jgi:hypothetical protein
VHFFTSRNIVMQLIRLIVPVLGAAALCAATPASAETYRAEARLAAPVAQPKDATIDRFQWRCEADACKGATDEKPRGVSFMRECRNVAAVLGPLASYASRGRVMGPTNVKACNRAVTDARLAQR